jgi:predicted XRE-type DNA-binding protein
MKKIFKVTEKILDVKIPIFNTILEYIKNKGFTQTKAGNELEVAQCEISKFKNRKYEHFSLERLFRFLKRIGYNVEIHLKGKEEKNERD